jgi:amidase
MDRIIAAQAPQFAIPLLGLPGLCVPVGGAHDEGVRVPVGVQLVAARFREDLLLDAAEVIEARYPRTTPIDPTWA